MVNKLDISEQSGPEKGVTLHVAIQAGAAAMQCKDCMTMNFRKLACFCIYLLFSMARA